MGIFNAAFIEPGEIHAFLATSRTKPKDFYITGHCYMNVIENVIFILYTIIDIVYGFLRSCRKRKIEGCPSIML